MDTTITQAEASRLLTSSALNRVEESIASAVGEPIVDPAPEVTLRILVAELSNSSLPIREIDAVFTDSADLLVAFGVALLVGEAPLPDEQEHDPDEGDQTEGTGKGKLVGLGRGFSLTYVCYLHFLVKADDAGLLALLKRRRIPVPKRFATRLASYYERAVASVQGRVTN